MEQLLNAVWLGFALAAFLAYLWQHPHMETAQGRKPKALIALACVAFLLFPVISTSDDLHPVPSTLEDVTKRIIQVWGHLPNAQNNPDISLLAVVVVLLTVPSFLVLRTALRGATAAQLTNRERIPSDGRSPPLF